MLITHNEYIIQDKKEILYLRIGGILLILFEAFILFSLLIKSDFAIIYISVLFGFLIYKNPIWGLYLLCGLSFLLGFYPGEARYLYIADIILIYIVIFYTAHLTTQKIVRLHKTPFDLWIFLILFFSLLSLFSAENHILMECARIRNPVNFVWETFNAKANQWLFPLKAFHNLLLCALLFWFAANRICGLTQIKKLSGIMLIGVFVSCIFGILDWLKLIKLDIIIPTIGNSLYFDNRIHAFFSHPNLFSQYLSLLSPFYFAIIVFSAFRKKARHYLAGGLILLSAFLTYQRGGWLAILMGIATLLILKNRQKIYDVYITKWKPAISLLLLTAFIFTTCGLMLLKANNAPLPEKLAENLKFADRSGIWLAASTLYFAKPIFGTGIGNYTVTHNDTFYGSHPYANQYKQTTLNSYLQILCETGPFALIAVVILLTLALRLALDNTMKLNQSNPEKKYLAALSSVFMSLIFYSLFQSLFAVEVMLILSFMFLGMLSFLVRDKIKDVYFFKTPYQRNVIFFILLIFLIFRLLF